jgi:hypothetical protein
MLVHAIDNDAREFYVRHGLEPSPTDPLHLMILIKDIAATLDAAAQSGWAGTLTSGCLQGFSARS